MRLFPTDIGQNYLGGNQTPKFLVEISRITGYDTAISILFMDLTGIKTFQAQQRFLKEHSV